MSDVQRQLLRSVYDKLSKKRSTPAKIDPFAVLPLELVENVLSYLSYPALVYDVLSLFQPSIATHVWIGISSVSRNGGKRSLSLIRPCGKISIYQPATRRSGSTQSRHASVAPEASSKKSLSVNSMVSKAPRSSTSSRDARVWPTLKSVSLTAVIKSRRGASVML